MKKPLSYPLILLLLFSSLYAQRSLVELNCPESEAMREVLVQPDGYLVMGAVVREEMVNRSLYRYHSPFVRKLDAELRVVWEKRFPEKRLFYLNNMAVSEEGIFVSGDLYGGSQGKVSGRLIKLSHQGELLFDKPLHYPGYHSAEGKHLLVLPDGDLIQHVTIYRNANSPGAPWLMRVRPNGDRVWAKLLTEGFFYSYVSSMALDAQGNLLVGGGGYPAYSDFKAETGRGLVRVLNPQSGDILQTQTYGSGSPQSSIAEIMPLADGGLWAVGGIHGNVRAGFLVEFDSELRVVRERQFTHPEKLYGYSFCWDPYRAQLIVGSWVNSTSKLKAGIMSFDGSWSELGPSEDFPIILERVEALANGELLIVHRKGFMIRG